MMTCCCSCTATYSGSVIYCDNAPVPGAAVTIKDHATGSVLDTTMTNSSGVYSGSVTLTTGSESVDVVVVKDGSTVTVTRTFVCGSNTVPPIVLPGTFVTVAPVGCGLGTIAPGVTVAFTLSGTTHTCTTGVGGVFGNGSACSLFLNNGTYTYTTTGGRFAPTSGTFVVNSATTCDPTFNPQLVPDTGYTCFCGVVYPVPTTLHGSILGAAFTLTSAGGVWDSGTFGPVTYPANASSCCGTLRSSGQTVTANNVHLCDFPSSLDGLSYEAVGPCPSSGSPVGTPQPFAMTWSTTPPLSGSGNAGFGTGTFGGYPCGPDLWPVTITE